MAAIQNIRFRLTAINSKGTHALEKYFLQGDSNIEVDNVPTSRVILSDKNRVLSNIPEGVIPPTESFWLAVSASTDSGDTWERLSIGLVENYVMTLNPSGERQVELTMYDAPEFRHNYTTPNQIALGDCDFGQLFTGSPSASDGTSWSADEKGNYPNGLLYDTNFSYSSEADFFPSISDVPLRLVYNNERKLDSIKTWLKNYGMSFILDCRGGFFYLEQNPAIEKYPFSGEVMEVGGNINKLNKSIDLTNFNNSITIVNPDGGVFDLYGDGPKEKVIVDNDISSFLGARMQAKRLHSSSHDTPSEYNITIPPTNKFLIGQSVCIREEDGDEETASVVGMNQRFDGGRWETTLVLDKPSYSVEKTIIDIQDNLEKEKSGDLEGQIFLRASSGASEFAQTYPIANNICAIGFGATPDTNSTGGALTYSGIETPIIIKGLINNAMISDSDADGSFYSAYTQLGSDEGNRLIRQIVVLGNEEPEDSDQFHRLRSINQRITWSRQTSDWNPSNVSSPMVLIGTTSNKYLVNFENITVSSHLDGCYAYPRAAKDLVVRYLNVWPVADSRVGYRPVELTESVDGTAGGDDFWSERGVMADDAALTNMSRDMKFNSYTYSVATFTNLTASVSGATISSGKPINLMFEFDSPVEPVSEAWKYFRRVNYGFDCWASYSDAGGNGLRPVVLYAYHNRGFQLDQQTYHWACLGTLSDPPIAYCSIEALRTTLYNQVVITDSNIIESNSVPNPTFPATITFNSEDLISTNSGKLRLLLFVPTYSTYPNATLSLFVQYAGMTSDFRMHSGSGMAIATESIERCELRYKQHVKNLLLFKGTNIKNAKKQFYLRLPASSNVKKITGIYASASEIDGGYIVPSDYSNLISEHQIFDEETGRFKKPKDLILSTYEYNPNAILGDRVIKIRNEEDWQVKTAYDKIKKQGYAYLKYVPAIYDANVSPPSPLSTDFISTSFLDRGTHSQIYFDMSKTPPYWCYVDLEGQYVGASDEICGTIGKVSFCLDTESSLREGVDKNTFKIMNVQYDYHGEITESAGRLVGGNAVLSYNQAQYLRNYRKINSIFKRVYGYDYEFY